MNDPNAWNPPVAGSGYPPQAPGYQPQDQQAPYQQPQQPQALVPYQAPGYQQQPQQPVSYQQLVPYQQPGYQQAQGIPPWQIYPSSEERSSALMMHLLPLLISLVGFGFVTAIIMYVSRRKDSPFVRRHAVQMMNFQLSMLLYSVGLGLLYFLGLLLSVIGIGLLLAIPALIALVALGVLSLVVTIIACTRANSGQEYTYPMNLRFVQG